MNKYEHIQQDAYEANMQLPKLGLVLFTFGNVSAADQKLGVFAIKPSGVPYEDLTPEKMVIVDFDAKMLKEICVLLLIQKHMLYYINIGKNRRHCAYTFNLCYRMGTGTKRYSILWNYTCRS